MGRWVSGKKLHFHDYPKHGSEKKKGRHWECVCGEVFVVTKDTWRVEHDLWYYEWKLV